MRPRNLMLAALATVVAAVAADVSAQQASQRGREQAAERTTPAAEVRLVYDREVYAYRAPGRRDPFRPLSDDDDMGPRFEQLVLQAIIYSTGADRSIAMLADHTGRIYRVRVGDVLGNARVVDIGPMRVVMAVDRLGTVRQEMLELKRRGGAQR